MQRGVANSGQELDDLHGGQTAFDSLWDRDRECSKSVVSVL